VRCREWAPNLAKLCLAGDFNQWNKAEHELEHIGEGMWELVLPPDSAGKCKIPTGSEIRYFCEDNQGNRFDRISPWARYVTQGERIYYNEVFLQLPEFEWGYKAPKPPRVLYIYESHVGICTPEPKISSYLEFADTVIPRIAKLGYNTIQLMAVMEHAYYASFGYQVRLSFFRAILSSV
jgi:1,4-alpha-glucan branching enzyme